MCTLEFELDPGEAERLLRTPPVAARRMGRIKPGKTHIIWHDTADGALRKANRALSEQAGRAGAHWRLERLAPEPGVVWLPAVAHQILAEADRAEALHKLPAGSLVAIAAFSGQSRSLALQGLGEAGASVEVIEGSVRGVAGDLACCRVMLCGEAAAMARLALELGRYCGLRVPRAGLAATALGFVRGTSPGARYLGTPALEGRITVRAGLTQLCGHLADVILYWAAQIPAARGPEPVHQMRVAVRRLRSALAVFRRASGPQAELAAALKDLAALLGAARDWDVFVSGYGAAVVGGFAQDARVTALLAAAERRRAANYAALHGFLAGPDWAELARRLAMLPHLAPWLEAKAAGPELRGQEAAARLDQPVAALARDALGRTYKQMRQMGAEFEALAPEAMHDLRKRAKRLRYAAEFFAPCFPAKPTRRFLERLEALQEALGAINDSHVAAGLMAQLGTAGAGFAGGVVQGFVAASTAEQALGAARAWRKLRQEDCFWE